MLTPRQYQQEAIERALEANLLVCDEPGLGKTLVAIETVRRLQEQSPIYRRPILVVCPKTVGPQWVEAIRQQQLSSPIYLLGKAGAGLPIVTGMCWIVTHYESLQYIFDRLSKIHWSVIIADEAHRIKNRQAQRTKYLKKLPAARRIALTGTPMDRSPSELWSILHWLSPEKFRSYWSWFAKYVDTKENYLGYKEIVGPKNLDKMAKEIAPFFIRRTKPEVAPELPPKIFQRIGVVMSDKQAELYKQLRKAKDIEVAIQDQHLIIANVLAKIIALQRLATDPKQLQLHADSAKLDWVLDYVTDNSDEKIVIFTKFRDTASFLAGALKAGLIMGGTQASLISPNARVLVGTIAAMGEGLNLDFATTAIFVEQEWSTQKMQQAVDRVHRMTSTVPKNIIYLYARGTVDELVLKALDKKWTEIELVYEFIKEAT